MAKLIVQHDEDPGIAIVLTEVPAGTPGKARGWHGSCTQCGWPMHRWDQNMAISSARFHVDGHESAL